VAATNRPDMIDPAMLRPGRLDKLLYVPLPTPKNRADIIGTLTRKTPLAPDVDVQAIAASDACEGFSGADMAALVREACINALRSQGPPPEDNFAPVTTPLVQREHFEEAFRNVMPSVSRADARRYVELRKKLRCSRNHISTSESTADLAAKAAAQKDGAPGSSSAPESQDAAPPGGSLQPST